MSESERRNNVELSEKVQDSQTTQQENEKAILLTKEHKVPVQTAVKLRDAAIVVSWISAVSTVILGGIAIAFAVLLESQSLLGFGLDSCLDFGSSVIILWRFYDKDIYSKTKELRACIMIGTLFVLSGVLLSIRCILALLSLERLHRPLVVLILSTVNAFCCLILGSSKVYLGIELESRALVTDSIITFIGALMSLFTLIFSGLYEYSKSLWYLDDSFGLICSCFLIFYGIRIVVISKMELRAYQRNSSTQLNT